MERTLVTAASSSAVPDLSRRVLQLQILTLVWMTVEAAVSHYESPSRKKHQTKVIIEDGVIKSFVFK